MFWERKSTTKKHPGPTATGQFYDVLDWWFWDDPETPGLLTRKKFEELGRLAVPADEQGNYAVSRIQSSIISNGKRSDTPLARRNHYFKLMSTYLISVRNRNPSAIDDWVCLEWQDNCFEVFKAYICVLEFWNYPFRWENIFDARSDPAALIFHEDKPVYCVLKNDIQSMQGRPFSFSAYTYRATWRFDIVDPKISVTSRIKREDYVEGQPIVRKNIVGSQLLIPTSSMGMEALWPKHGE